MDVTLPNGKIIRGVPDGTSKDDIMNKAISSGLATRKDFDLGVEGPDYAALQKSVVYPAEAGSINAFLGGARRGMENVGEGVLQRGAELGEFLGFDTSDFQKNLKLTGDIREQQFKETEKESPVSSLVGGVAGSIAAFPAAPARIGQAVTAGGAFGALQPTDKPSDIAKNIVIDAALGGVAAAAAPYIQKGFNKSQALFSGIYKKATGADPRPSMFTKSGALSDEGKSAIKKIGISEEDFARIYGSLDNNLDPVAAARMSRADEQGIPLTTAQATQDFAQQEAEQTLKAGISSESVAARSQAEGQQESIRAAQETFERGFGEMSDREARGGIVQSALRDMEKQGARNVSDLYNQASKIAGDNAPINNAAILDVVDDQMLRPVDDKVVTSLESLLGKFGIIEGEVSQAGRFNQIIDSAGNKVKFRGEQTPLNLDNAEDFRKGLNQIRGADQSGAVSNVIKSLDDQVESVVKDMSAGSARTEAFQAARGAAREQKQTFSQKDIIQNLVGYKKGTATDIIQPDRVIQSILSGANTVGNLKRVKSTLMSNPTNKTVDAWKSIQAQGVADLFGKSINPSTGDISGARLKSAIKEFGGGSSKEGDKRLKILLGDKYKQFKNMSDAIGDATIPLKGTSNPSGTAYKILNFMTRAGSVGTFGADTVVSLFNKAKSASKAKSTLRQIEKASPEKVKQAVKANDDLIDSYIRLGLTGTLREQ
jgi:hypothetical protein